MCQRIMIAHWVTQKLVCTIQEELMLSQGPSLNSKRQQMRETAQGRKTWLWRWKEPWTKDCEQFPEAEKGKKINFWTKHSGCTPAAPALGVKKCSSGLQGWPQIHRALMKSLSYKRPSFKNQLLCLSPPPSRTHGLLRRRGVRGWGRVWQITFIWAWRSHCLLELWLPTQDQGPATFWHGTGKGQ